MPHRHQVLEPRWWTYASPFVVKVFGLVLGGLIGLVTWLVIQSFKHDAENARNDAVNGMVLQRLDRIENKVDVLIQRP